MPQLLHLISRAPVKPATLQSQPNSEHKDGVASPAPGPRGEPPGSAEMRWRGVRWRGDCGLSLGCSVAGAGEAYAGPLRWRSMSWKGLGPCTVAPLAMRGAEASRPEGGSQRGCGRSSGAGACWPGAAAAAMPARPNEKVWESARQTVEGHGVTVACLPKERSGKLRFAGPVMPTWRCCIRRGCSGCHGR